MTVPKPPLGRVRIMAQSEAADSITQLDALTAAQSTLETICIALRMQSDVPAIHAEVALRDTVRALASLGFGPDNMRIAYEQMAQQSGYPLTK